MCDDDRTERVEECSMCGDEACICDEVCDVCENWKENCECPALEEKKCLNCGITMDIIVTSGETYYICSKCDDPFGREENKRMDTQDMAKEMEIDDGFSN